jgi:hypothetical protein
MSNTPTTPELPKGKTTGYKYVGDETLEKVTLPSGRVVIFKSSSNEEIEAAIKEQPSLEKYFEKG